MRCFLILSILFFSASIEAQETLAELLNRYNENKVPYITAEELSMPKTNAVILDARELEEYKISHLGEAIYVGYNAFQIDSVIKLIPKKETPIVVYCSLGIRSETIANRLKKEGYTNVENLYGGIFEWKNKQFPIYNSVGKETDSIHAFSKSWSKWLHEGVKVYNNKSNN